MSAPRQYETSRFDEGQDSFLLKGFTLVAIINVAPEVGPGPPNSDLVGQTGQLCKVTRGQVACCLAIKPTAFVHHLNRDNWHNIPQLLEAVWAPLYSKINNLPQL